MFVNSQLQRNLKISSFNVILLIAENFAKILNKKPRSQLQRGYRLIKINELADRENWNTYNEWKLDFVGDIICANVEETNRLSSNTKSGIGKSSKEVE